MNKYHLSDTSRLFSFTEEGCKLTVTLWQIVALHDFADVKAGTPGGWLEEENALSQQGNCWIYDENSVVFAGARIEGDARVTRACTISHQALIQDQAWIDGSSISHDATISDNVTVQSSQVSGECHLYGNARILHNSEIIAARGMTQESNRCCKSMTTLPSAVHGWCIRPKSMVRP